MFYKEKARAYFSAVNNYDAATIEKMVDENYIQHNPFVPTGRAAFLSILPKLRTHGSQIKNVRMLEDGQHIIMHHRWENASPFGHDKMVAFHIIRFDEPSQQIAEHWSVMTPDSLATSSPLSLSDGSTQIKDLTKTNENQARVADLFQKLTQRHHGELAPLLPHFFHTSFLNSNPRTFDALNIRYQKQHKIFGEGNFVLSIFEGVKSGVFVAVYDLFRLENQKIAEHWQIFQEIPNHNLANDNTMFGF